MTIPANAIVQVTPGVLAVGGSGLDLLGLFLTTSWRPPIGSVQSFASVQAVQNYFGSGSVEAEKAAVYFNGYEGETRSPNALLFAQYPLEAVWAYLRGGNVSNLTLAELQALSGDLSVVIDGTPQTASINLAAATSFSSAAKIIQTALGISGVQVAEITGEITGTTLTVSGVTSGTISIGDVVTGTGVSTGTRIVGQLTGTGGVGTYTVDTNQTAISQTMDVEAPAVFYDSTSGAFVIQSGTSGDASTIAYATDAMATSLELTQATGAVVSQGADAAVPGTFMDGVIQVSTNWATFLTLFDPDEGVGNADKLAFAEWTNDQDNRYAFVCRDADESPTVTVPATSSLGYLIGQADLGGTFLVHDAGDADDVAPFVSGVAAAIDFNRLEGRTTFAFRRQEGIAATVTDETAAANLLANGYNFYGAYATAADEFVWLYNGQVSGAFLWMDSYVNQIWLNNQLQVALLNLLGSAGSIPYNAAGKAMIEGAIAGPVNAALNFGAIRPGVTLSQSQKNSINSAAGDVNAAAAVETQGWYLKVGDATPQQRAARESPPCIFWYADGQSVQKIELASINVQ